MSYRGRAKKFLKSQNISIGDIISVKKDDAEYRGMLLDRAEDADELHIVLKMDSGYNVGIALNGSEVKLLEKGDKPEINLPPLDIQRDPEKMDEANISGKAIMNILSENMKPEFWVQSARAVADEITEGADGVVVAHGTDTMHYTAAALSFILETPVPIIITGAQRSSDRPSSDAFINLMSSVAMAKSDIAEVTVCMHATENDNQAHIHRGTRVRKMHTSRRDTFNSINSPPLARVKDGRVKIIDKTFTPRKRGECQLEVNDSLEEKVGFIKSYPGIAAELMDYHIDKGYRGILMEGTGLGHCPDHLIPSLERAADEEILVVMTSQCLYGRTNLNVYSTGRKILSSGVISVGDMLPETAYVKLVWALGQTNQLEEVKTIMQTNLKGEMDEKSSSKYFLRDYGE